MSRGHSRWGNRHLAAKSLFFAALVAVVAPFGVARAATIIEGPFSEGPFSGSTMGMFDVPQFDTLGGTRTLTGVEVEVIIDTFDGKREFDNQSPTGGMVTLAIGSTVRVKGPIPGVGSQIVVIPDAVTTASTVITATTGDLPADFAGTDYAFVDGGILSDLKTASRSAAGDLAPYIGAGLVTFNWDLAGNSFTGQDVSVTGGGTFRTTNTTYNFHTTVYYTYVPEPGTLALAGIGAATFAMAAAARRRGRVLRR